jgi:hypothetical protein
MLDLDLTEIMQARLPLGVLAQIVRETLGNQDVTGIAAGHDPFRNVDGGTGDVGPVIHVSSATNRPAMDAHPQFQARITQQRFADFERALNRCFWCREKDQRHAVTGRKASQLTLGFGGTKLFRTANDVIKLLLDLLLLVDEQFRVADNIDE